MTASTVPTGTVVIVPAPRAASPSTGPALPRIPVPAPRTPVDRHVDGGNGGNGTDGTDPRPATGGRHRAASATDTPAARAPRRTRRDTVARAVTIAARTGSVVTLGAMLVMAAAAAGLSDGHAPTGEAAAVANTTLR